MKYNSWVEIVKDSCLKSKKLGDEYYNRLAYEHQEIIKQGANEYWMDLINSQEKFNHNNNGLVLPFIYGLTDIDPIKGSKTIFVNGGNKIDGIEIILENNTTINTSLHTLIKTKRGFIRAEDLEEGDEIC